METEDIDRLCSDFSKCEELLKIKRDVCQKMIDNKDEFITALLIQLLDSQSKMNKTTIDVLKMNFANVSLAAVTALIAVSALGISLGYSCILTPSLVTKIRGENGSNPVSKMQVEKSILDGDRKTSMCPVPV